MIYITVLSLLGNMAELLFRGTSVNHDQVFLLVLALFMRLALECLTLDTVIVRRWPVVNGFNSRRLDSRRGPLRLAMNGARQRGRTAFVDPT
jgi:hypothetical protein